MQIELLGLVTVLFGLAVFVLPPSAAFSTMVACTVFGAASAISLPMLGGASILVPNLFLVFYVLRVFMAYGEGPALAALQPSKTGFILLILTVFGLLSAFTYPYLFQGDVQTMIVERTAGARSVISLTALRFSSNNITQPVYALGGFLCFAFTYSFFRGGGREKQFVDALMLVGAVNIGFAFADIVTYFTGTGALLGFVRTANYALLTGAEKGGLKRISGTFPEASAFADFTLVIFAVSATLWLFRIRSRSTGLVAGLSFVFLLLSTSATALVGLAVVTPVLFTQALAASARTPGAGRPAALLSMAVFVPLLLFAIIVLVPGVADALHGFLDEMLLSKADSQSGRERATWNGVAWQTFLDTSGIGAGLGSARASSFVLVLLSNLGIPGFVLFCVFVFMLLTSRARQEPDHIGPAVKAAKNGIFATLVTAVISGTGYDLGLLFYVLAGFISAQVDPLLQMADRRRVRLTRADYRLDDGEAVP